jgi:hypothetical protein
MERKKESVNAVFERVFGAKERRAAVSSAAAESVHGVMSRHIATPTVVNRCAMSDGDRAFAAEMVKVYLTAAEIAFQAFHRIVLSVERTEAAAEALLQVDLLQERMARNGIDIESVAALRNKISAVSEESSLAPDERASLVAVLTKALDVTDALASFVGKVARYALKLQLAQEGAHRALDAFEDYRFARDVRTELSLIGE